MPDFSIKSIIHDYSVKFIDNIPDTLQGILLDGDVIIIDNKLLTLYPDLSSILTGYKIIVIDANENQKSYEGLKPIITELIESGFRRNHRLVGIGGGIVQDITAFTASIMYRGVQWIFFPTTLLAQGDSCIGSKTSINFGAYKNQLGGFYPPHEILIDMNVLETLSLADMQSGFGEMSHYFVIAGEADFEYYKQNYPNASVDKSILAKIVGRSLEIKKGYIEIDEFDINERQVFNYGHSFGHAIESLTNYAIPHGIAVSIGMDMANYISVQLKLLDPNIRMEIRELLEQIWAGYDVRQLQVDTFRNALAKDKKNVGKELRLILCKGYGNVFKAAVPNDENLHAWLDNYLRNEF